MKRFTALPLVLCLGLCASLPTPTCDTAPKVRAAAALALQALDRACPIDMENVR